ncbi:MAG: ABC transporter ATP-binding protein [Lachnospiraceae bacterium]|nr:ABC transporter ATP-binding protein [Lachnospiraceae bacterium]
MLMEERTRREKMYSIGYSPSLEKYILSCVVCWIAWYNRYFEISKEEYDLYKTDIEQLDRIAHECHEWGEFSERFLCSEENEENSPAQSETYSLLKEGLVPFDKTKCEFI